MKELKVKFEVKTFKNKDGKDIEYNSLTLELGGNEFALFPRAEDKKLLNYLLAQEQDK